MFIFKCGWKQLCISEQTTQFAIRESGGHALSFPSFLLLPPPGEQMERTKHKAPTLVVSASVEFPRTRNTPGSASCLPAPGKPQLFSQLLPTGVGMSRIWHKVALEGKQ